MRSVSTTPEITALQSRKENPPVCAFGISGGKDSHAMALAGNRYLDEIGFTGTRLAVHADLGRAEWIQSKDKCHELTDSLQSNRWLGDVNPDLLSEQQMAGLAIAKSIAKERAALEARIPVELLYGKGWPLRVHTQAEAQILAAVRIQVSQLQGLTSKYLDACSIRTRYQELIANRDARVGAIQTIPVINASQGQGQMMFTF